MNTTHKNKHLGRWAISCLFALMFCLAADAAVYPFNYSDSGAVPQGGGTLAFEHAVSGIPTTITGIELILTFNDSSSLTGSGTGIQGHLILGTDVSSPFVNFYPTATSSSGSQRIYDVIFSTTQPDGFNNLNPNNTWGLELWDNSSSMIENGLVSWSLDVTAVPEPITYALPLFGLIFLGGTVGRLYLRQRREEKAEN